MADTYVYLIHEGDWDSDAYLGGQPEASPAGKDRRRRPALAADMDASFPEHKAFQKAVVRPRRPRRRGRSPAEHDATAAPSTPGAKGRNVEDAVYTDGPFPDTSEVITGFYLVETDDEDTARRVAALVPTGGHIEWRKVFPMGDRECRSGRVSSRRRWPRIVRALASFTGSLDDAEEYAAEAVARAAAHARGRSIELAAWCTSVAKRAWLDDARATPVERLAGALSWPTELGPSRDGARPPWTPTTWPSTRGRSSTTASPCSSSPATTAISPRPRWCWRCASCAA